MKRLAIAVFCLSLVAITAEAQNPIRLEGQIRELAWEGERLTIRLHRDRYPIVAYEETRVRWFNGLRSHARELRKGDSIRVEGNQERNQIVAGDITILQRDEHRP